LHNSLPNRYSVSSIPAFAPLRSVMCGLRRPYPFACLTCLFNVISVITTSSNHTRLMDFNASLLESPFALMKACCQLAETLVWFLLLQQLSEDFYYYLSCWLVLQHVYMLHV